MTIKALFLKVPRKKGISFSRDTMSFLLGVFGIVHETIMTNADRPDLLFLFMGMIGLPAFLRVDSTGLHAAVRKPTPDPVEPIEPSEIVEHESLEDVPMSRGEIDVIFRDERKSI